ncbi:mitochondrial ribosomal small subunit component [Chytridiales sp. JEL 0842]|nr:mitochondrial ribosomal small subunit component [Chytridiales sp. JEL 0842]
MPKPKRALRNNPFSILKTYAKHQSVLSASTASPSRRFTPNTPSEPRHSAWFPAVSLHPPGPAPLPYVVPTEVGHFTPPTNPTTPPSEQTFKRVKPSQLKPVYTTQPPTITYPEDTLRQRFYKLHPFELLRPRSLVETEESILEAIEQGEQGGKAGKEWDEQAKVSGESVVQRALYLARHENQPLEVAYSLALSSFYTHRALEETQHQIRKQSLLNLLSERQAAHAALVEAAEAEYARTGDQKVLDELPEAPVEGVGRGVQMFREREEGEVEKGLEYIKAVSKERDERRAIQEQMAMYDAKNLQRLNEEAAETAGGGVKASP